MVSGIEVEEVRCQTCCEGNGRAMWGWCKALEVLAKQHQNMMCTKNCLNPCWGSDDPWCTSLFGNVLFSTPACFVTYSHVLTSVQLPWQKGQSFSTYQLEAPTEPFHMYCFGITDMPWIHIWASFPKNPIGSKDECSQAITRESVTLRSWISGSIRAGRIPPPIADIVLPFYLFLPLQHYQLYLWPKLWKYQFVPLEENLYIGKKGPEECKHWPRVQMSPPLCHRLPVFGMCLLKPNS